jgi:hypothetical protein
MEDFDRIPRTHQTIFPGQAHHSQHISGPVQVRVSGTHLQMTHEQCVSRAMKVIMNALVVDVREHSACFAALVTMNIDHLHELLHELVAALRENKVLRDGELDRVGKLLFWLLCLP